MREFGKALWNKRGSPGLDLDRWKVKMIEFSLFLRVILYFPLLALLWAIFLVGDLKIPSEGMQD